MLAREIAHCFCSVASASAFAGSHLGRGRLLKARAVSSNLKSPIDCLLVKRSWSSPIPDLAGKKCLVTTLAMAQTAGMTDVPLVVVYVTVPNKELSTCMDSFDVSAAASVATILATDLVTNKLAACVNQVPGVVSTYMWEGKVETDQEILLIIKTRHSLVDALTVHVKAKHPYEVPEVIALPILGGSDDYIRWVAKNTSEHSKA